MDDRIELREDFEFEAPVDSDAPLPGPESEMPDPLVQSYSLFADREDEPEAGDATDTPIDVLMKSGQPRLSLVHGDDDPDDDEEGLIELAPVEPAAEVAETTSDTWPWLADVEKAEQDEDAKTAAISCGLDGHYASDLISSESAPTACGARPTIGDVAQRRPMPALPRPGEIAAVANKMGSQFAGDARIQRTPEVPTLVTPAPRTFTPSTPAKFAPERITSGVIDMPAMRTAPNAAAAVGSASIATPSIASSAASISNMVASVAAVSAPTQAPSTRKLPETPKRIGGGKLVQTRLTWKPGNPFADATRTDGVPGRFRWELMLSTACGTAVFGLAFFWIMRMVF